MRWTPANLLFALVVSALCVTARAEDLQRLIVDATVNEMPRGHVFLLWDGDESYYARESDLTIWRVRRPFPESINMDSLDYVPLSEIGGVTVAVDDDQLSARIDFPPDALQAMFVDGSRDRHLSPTTGTGAFLDYDLSYISSTENYVGAFITPAVFSYGGVASSGFAYRSDDATLEDGSQREHLIRLDTTFVRDDPEKMRSYRVGDVVSATGPWGGGYRIGGIQIARNFGTQPTNINYPVPAIDGSARVPSSVDLYVNGVLRQQEDVEPGEFRISDVPVVTGTGEVKVVVTDVLGREQVYFQDFYASTSLLRPGLSEYSYSLGFLRRNFGEVSNDYDEFAFVGSYRQGITNRFTAGGRIDASTDVQLLAGSADWQIGGAGIVTAGLGASFSEPGTGAAWLLGYDFRDSDYRLNARVTGTSERFALMDSDLTSEIPELQYSVSAGWDRNLPGSISATIVHQGYRESEDRTIYTVGYSQSVAPGFFVSAYTGYSVASESDFMFGLSMNRAFGGRRSANASATSQGGESQVRMEAQTALPTGPGIGYRVGTTLADENQFDASVIGQSDFGQYSLDIQRRDGKTPWIANTNGSLAWMAGRGYAARSVDDGFAVVKVGDFENVRVYLENNEIGRSDSEGRVFLPSLRPYEANRLSIEPNDLPLGARVDSTQLNVAPYYRSGALVEFEVARVRAVVFRAYQLDGTPVPVGAAVRLNGKGEALPVGRDGLVYVSDLQPDSRFEVEWSGESCELRVPMPADEHPLSDLGQFTCERMSR